MNEVETLQADLSAKAAEITKLSGECAELKTWAGIGKTLHAELQAEAERLAGCLQLGESYAAALKHFSTDELKNTCADLEKQWAAKRGPNAEGEHNNNNAITTARTDENAFSAY